MALDRVIWCDRGWQPLHYGFCPNEKAWKREMKRLGVTDEPYPATDGRCTIFEKTDKNERCIIVTVADGSEGKHSLIEVVGLLVHEAAHVWQYVLDDIGERKPSPEFEAYSMQAISMGLINAFSQSRGLPQRAT